MKKRTFQLLMLLVVTFSASNLYAQLVASYKFNPGADSLKNDATGMTAEFAPDYLYTLPREGLPGGQIIWISRTPVKATDRFGNPNSAFAFKTHAITGDVISNVIIQKEPLDLGDKNPEYTFAAWIKLFQNPSEWEIIASIGEKGFDQIISVQPNLLNIGSFHQGSHLAKNIHAPLPSLNEWHQIVSIRTRDSIFLYVDGEIATKDKVEGPMLPTNKLTIGSRSSYEYGFNGAIDDVKVYKNALTAHEVKALYEEDLIATNIEDAFLTEADPEIYPNPVSGQLYLTIPQRAGLPEEVKIKDLSGVELQTFSNFSGNNQNLFDVSNLPSGIYLVQVVTDKGHFYKKIVKN